MSRGRPQLPALVRIITSVLVLSVAVGAAAARTTRPRADDRLPRQMNLDRLLDFAEQCVRDARAQRSNPNLRPIERIAAAARASGKLMQAYGKTVWLQGNVRETIDRGPVRFTPPPAVPLRSGATAPATTRPAAIVVPITDVLIDNDDGHLVVLQMTPERAARVRVGKTGHFTARVVRLRRIGDGRWEVWLRHSRVPRRIDRWIPDGGRPDYRKRIGAPAP